MFDTRALFRDDAAAVGWPGPLKDSAPAKRVGGNKGSTGAMQQKQYILYISLMKYQAGSEEMGEERRTRGEDVGEKKREERERRRRGEGGKGGTSNLL